MRFILRHYCFCGNNYTTYANCSVAPQTYTVSGTSYTCQGCNYLCQSNSAELCGGNWALNVYQIG